MIKFEPNEQIIKVIRRHYLVLVPEIFTLVLLALAPLAFYALLLSGLFPLSLEIQDLVREFFEKWKAFGYSIWLLLLWVFFFVGWTDYYLDLWVITDRRIIDVEQKGFFHREVTTFMYSQIQDITVETRGFIETFFKFGTLHVQTAGHNREILIRDAHQPEEARVLILNLQQKAKASQ